MMVLIFKTEYLSIRQAQIQIAALPLIKWTLNKLGNR